ncbi:MAG: cytochrome C oxidase subunit IV family protein [Omnitrophica WOR_2 bacterium]
MDIDNKVEKHAQPNYLVVFIALAILTALEVAVTYTPLPRVPILVPMMLLKAALVALYYMHLKFDRRIFGILFVIGLVFGVSLMISFLLLIQSHL